MAKDAERSDEIGRHMTRRVGLVLSRGGAIVLAAVAAACKDSEPVVTGPGTTTTPTVAAVAVTPARDTLESLGATLQLSATASDASGNAMAGQAFTWSSSDTSVVSVDDGLVTGRANGTATVSAATGGVTGEATITVHQVVTTVQLSGGVDTLTALGDTVRLSAAATDARNNPVSGRGVGWGSSDSAVATVVDGLVTAEGPGSATIRATVDGTDAGESITVVQVVGSVTASPDTTFLTALDATVQLVAAATDANDFPIAGAMFTWMSSDTAVVTVNPAGVAMARGNGTATITATATGTSTSAGVSVQVAQVVHSIGISPPVDSTDALGDTLTFVGSPLDSLGSVVASAAVTWTSQDPAVAIVSSTNGDTASVVSVADGTAILAATAGSFADSTTLVVRQQAALINLVTEPAGARAGITFATQPAVELVDRLGSPVAGDSATVMTAVVDSGGGTLAGTLTATAVGGIATFTDLRIDGTVGDRRLRFESTGLQSATSGAFRMDAGNPGAIAIASGDGQTGLADTPLSLPFVVSVADSFANPLGGVEILWTVVSGGALPETTVTDTTGMSSNTYQLGLFADVDTVDAEVVGNSNLRARFLATATPNATITGTITAASGFLAPPVATATVGGALTASATGPGRAAPARSTSKAGLPGPVVTTREAAQRTSNAVEYVPGELLVTFRPTSAVAAPPGAPSAATMSGARQAAASIRGALAAAGAPSGFSVTGVSPVTHTALIRVADPSALGAVQATLRARSDVVAVERNPIIRLSNTAQQVTVSSLPGDPLYPYQAWQYSLMDLPEAWDITTGSANVIVAVVDDGIRFDHDGIAPVLTQDGFDFVDNSYSYSLCAGGSIGAAGDGDGPDADPTQPTNMNYDANQGCITGARTSGNHGMHVAGTIGSPGGDGKWGTGVNWNVSIRPVRGLDIIGSGTYYAIAQGILYAAGLPADDGAGGFVQPAGGPARVINLSLGGSSPSQILASAVQAADSVGTLIVAAAGNSASSQPLYPAAYPETISVSAVSALGTLATYSSYGSTVDIAAPGGELLLGGSWGVWSTAWDYVNGTPHLAGWQGTSMATPHVTGAAALLLADDPSLTAAHVKARLLNYAVDVGSPGRDNEYGWGIVNVRNSLTQTLEPPGTMYAVLVDSTGAAVQTVPTDQAGTYTFTQVADGDYTVYGGQDINGDQILGVPFRRWGAFGGSATPAPITVNGAATHQASFDIALPVELEPNDDVSTANPLAVGGYTSGGFANTAEVDIYSVTIPAAGTYTFETSADGACGFAGWEDTVIELYDSNSMLLAQNDDIDAAGYDYCSRITSVLQPGRYYLAVSGLVGSSAYFLEVR